MVQSTTSLSRSYLKDVLQLNLWWQMEYQELYFGTTIDSTFVLYILGLRYSQEIWDLGRNDFLNWEESHII